MRVIFCLVLANNYITILISKHLLANIILCEHVLEMHHAEDIFIVTHCYCLKLDNII